MDPNRLIKNNDIVAWPLLLHRDLVPKSPIDQTDSCLANFRWKHEFLRLRRIGFQASINQFAVHPPKRRRILIALELFGVKLAWLWKRDLRRTPARSVPIRREPMLTRQLQKLPQQGSGGDR